MATEQDRRPDEGLPGPGDQMRKTSSPKPWPWKVDVIFFFLGILMLGAIIGSLRYLDHHEANEWQGPKTHRLVLGICVSVLCFFFLVSFSNCLLRIEQIHSPYSTFPAVSYGSDTRLKRLATFITQSFTARLCAFVPFFTFTIVVAAAAAIVPWTQSIFVQRKAFEPAPPRHPQYGPSWVVIARDVDPDKTSQYGVAHKGPALMNAIHQAISGYNKAGAPDWWCEEYGTGQTRCIWDEYATLQVRSQCQDISDQLEISSTYSMFEAMRDLDSIPPYDPFDEWQHNISSPFIISLKDTTYVTLSNLQSYTGPWRSDQDGILSSKRSNQISKEALERLQKFSTFIINPVEPQKIKKPVYNQTAGTLQNFQIIYAELGISGQFTDGELSWIDIKRGESTAWECSLDTVLQTKHADFNLYSNWPVDLKERDNYNWQNPSAMPIMPMTNFSKEWSCAENPEDCFGEDRETIDYLWNNTKYSIDRRVQTIISRDLGTQMVGSGFFDGWRTVNPDSSPKIGTTSQSTTLIILQIIDSLRKNYGGSYYWNIANTFNRLGDSLGHWIRNYYYPDCQRVWVDRKQCEYTLTFGELSRNTSRYLVHWKYIAWPAALALTTALIMFAAALDEKFARIKLGADEDSPRGEGEGSNSS